MCLLDLLFVYRTDRDKRRRQEGRRSHSAKTRREKFVCPKPEPDRNPGVVGGGWVHRQVVAACRWPVPSGQATIERERERGNQRKEQKGERTSPKILQTEPIGKNHATRHLNTQGRPRRNSEFVRQELYRQNPKPRRTLSETAKREGTGIPTKGR